MSENQSAVNKAVVRAFIEDVCFQSQDFRTDPEDLRTKFHYWVKQKIQEDPDFLTLGMMANGYKKDAGKYIGIATENPLKRVLPATADSQPPTADKAGGSK